MGVECGVVTTPIDQERFHEIDRIVMGESFALQNKMGRFFEERIYQEELCRRCARVGLRAQTEVMLRISHRDFCKDYFLDLLVENSAIYELKTVEALNPVHQRQLLNYLHILDLRHGKLINFRPASVEARFVSTRLNKEKRLVFSVEENEWDNTSEEARGLRVSLLDLLAEWGCFLDSNLYKEAMLHLNAAVAPGLQQVAIVSGGNVIGKQMMTLLTNDSAWHLSAHNDHLDSYEIHMRRLLAHTNLRSIHWINLNHHKVLLKTLRKK